MPSMPERSIASQDSIVVAPICGEPKKFGNSSKGLPFAGSTANTTNAALAERLKSGHIPGAAVDVFAVEPANGNPLLELPNFFGSPHIGATTMESWEAMLRSGMEGIEKAYRPEPGVYPFD